MSTLPAATQDEEYQPLVVNIVGHDAPGRWLRAGWTDFKNNPVSGLFYGLMFSLIGWVTIGGLVLADMERLLLPALASGILVGPLLAVGLYRVSQRSIAARKGLEVTAGHKLSGTQIALTGAVLMTVVMIWVRMATIIYALFFGLQPFPGLEEAIHDVFFTSNGLAMLAVGSVVGGMFAALVYAISAFSFPLLVDQDVDCFTAMGCSFVAVTRNFWVMVHWAVIIIALATFGFLTLLVGMIVVFPVLGHATWHCYDDVFNNTTEAAAQ